MISAGFFTALIENPELPIRQKIESAIFRRILIGIAMGSTAFYIFTSPFGKKSGAHINPAVSIVQYRLGNLDLADTIFYILFQFIGGIAGMYLIYMLFPNRIADPSVNYIVTQPGVCGVSIAFFAEFLISFLLILVVLFTGEDEHFRGVTNYFVAGLIVLYVTFEAPLSGFSMNPARTFASSVISNQWQSCWIYYVAPLLGMLAGQMIYSYQLKIKLTKVNK